MNPDPATRHMRPAALAAFVEVQTKPTSLLVFLYCIALSLRSGSPIRMLPTALFFSATLLIDLATTAINNYLGWKRDGEALGMLQMHARLIVASLLAAATVTGLVLVWVTRDWLILLLGAACYLVGVVYTAGPWPLINSPLSEALSGLLYGSGIPFLYLQIQAPGRLFQLTRLEQSAAAGATPLGAASSLRLMLQLDPLLLLRFALVAAIPTLLVAAVMLANNTRDMERDRERGRRTLPLRIGLARSLALFAWLELLPIVLVVPAVLGGAFGWPSLLVLALLPASWKRVRRYQADPDRARAFGLALVQLRVVLLALSGTLLLDAALGFAR